jgi:hypothetical protein
MAREREARRVAREAAQNAERPCKDCGALKPPTAFELLPSGGLRGICRDCRTEQKSASRRRARAAHRETPEYQAELERKEVVRAERATAKAREQADLQAAKEAEWAALRAAEIARRRKRQERKRGIRQRPLSPERQREVAAAIPQLIALLMGTSPRERICDQQSWEAAANQLRQLWLQSGDKVCVACKATVPPSSLLPPGPATFYPGKCQRCAAAVYGEHHRSVFGSEPQGPRSIAMLDGSRITIAELARRHREREQAR